MLSENKDSSRVVAAAASVATTGDQDNTSSTNVENVKATTVGLQANNSALKQDQVPNEQLPSVSSTNNKGEEQREKPTNVLNGHLASGPDSPTIHSGVNKSPINRRGANQPPAVDTGTVLTDSAPTESSSSAVATALLSSLRTGGKVSTSPAQSASGNFQAPPGVQLPSNTAASGNSSNMYNNMNIGGNGAMSNSPNQQQMINALLAAHMSQQSNQGVAQSNTSQQQQQQMLWNTNKQVFTPSNQSNGNKLQSQVQSLSPTNDSSSQQHHNAILNLLNTAQQQTSSGQQQQANLALQGMLSSMMLNNPQQFNSNGNAGVYPSQVHPLPSQLMSQFLGNNSQQSAAAAASAVQGLFGLQNVNNVNGGSPNGKRGRDDTQSPVTSMQSAQAAFLAHLRHQSMNGHSSPTNTPMQLQPPPQQQQHHLGPGFIQTSQLKKIHKFGGIGGSPRSAAASMLPVNNGINGSDGEDDEGYDGVILDCPPAIKREKGRVYVVRGHLKKWDGRRFARCCGVERCTKLAQGPTNFCKGHGGGTRCKTQGCKKAARGGSDCCAVHGGGKRCKYSGCAKAAVGNDFCRRHGGGKRCQKQGCNATAKGSQMMCGLHDEELSSNKEVNGNRDDIEERRIRSSSETSYQSSYSGKSNLADSVKGSDSVKGEAKPALKDDQAENDAAISSLLSIGKNVVQGLPPPPVSTKVVSVTSTTTTQSSTLNSSKNPLVTGGVLSPSSSAVVPLESISGQGPNAPEKTNSASINANQTASATGNKTLTAMAVQ